ncbi:MAG: hypothetical protein J5611_02390 [Alphaproteobacteria bacterium]|nr:hypothetical protein [Alphaproteobacteria bacterium]
MKALSLSLLIALYALPTMAAGVSRIIPGTDTTTSGAQIQKSEPVNENSETVRGAVISRAARTVGKTRTAVARTVANRAQTTETSTQNRSAATRAAAAASEARGGLAATVRRSGLSSRVESASINANPAVRRAGLTLRPSVAEVGGRAVLASGEQTGSNIDSEIRKLQSRAATQNMDAAEIAAAKERMQQSADLNRSCQEQYNDCMDQFCAVVDANQKRCSCSANLSKYTKVEAAVKEANTKLNEVAQNIRYVGLSADEISAIMSATEAEEALSGKKDTTESRNMLAEIEKMIKDPTTSSMSYSETSDNYGMLDIDLDFSASDVSDLFNLDFLDGGDSGSIAKLRGSSLYNAAKKRCNAIITQCKDIGGSADQITGNYDLAIDKDCIAYEAGLNKMNETLVSNVRSATRMLQKARLAVLENQNSYNARECVSALEKCMTDEMVCGENYNKCIDPTKMFIDENGNVVLGKNINSIQEYMENYNNANVDKDFLSAAYNSTISDTSCRTALGGTQTGSGGDGHCIVKYLLGKIGTKQKATDEGLCRPVLDKCRAYTYDTRGNYSAYNDIVVNYIQRAMVNIKAAQYRIVSDYASSCLTDIASCYNDQVSQITSWSATAQANSIYNIMRGACRNVALTCGYAVFANSSDANMCPDDNPDACIEHVSEIFYQSLLCPDNSLYINGTQSHDVDANNTRAGWVNSMCKCQTGFVVFNGACLPECENSGEYLSTGICSKTACPSNSSEVSEENAEFYGHCKCNSSRHWYNNACRLCPANSQEVSSPGQNGATAMGGWCRCDTSDSTYPYVASTNGLTCIQCKAKEISSNGQWTGNYIPVYNSDYTACQCPGGATYHPELSCCGSFSYCQNLSQSQGSVVVQN